MYVHISQLIWGVTSLWTLMCMGWLVSLLQSNKKAGKLHFHATIGALLFISPSFLTSCIVTKTIFWKFYKLWEWLDKYLERLRDFHYYPVLTHQKFKFRIIFKGKPKNLCIDILYFVSKFYWMWPNYCLYLIKKITKLYHGILSRAAERSAAKRKIFPI